MESFFVKDNIKKVFEQYISNDFFELQELQHTNMYEHIELLKRDNSNLTQLRLQTKIKMKSVKQINIWVIVRVAHSSNGID